MKIIFRIIYLITIISLNSCSNKSESKINFYESHEKNRKNVPFSDIVQVDNLYFLTGQIGKNHKTNKLVLGGIEKETEQAILNLKDVLNHHNLKLKNIIKCTVILSDIDDFHKMNKIYRRFFKDNLPARTTFAANLVGNAKIEIEAIAAKK